MSDRQRIVVVDTTAGEAELVSLRADLGRDAVVLAAPTSEAKRVVGTLRVEPQVEVLLAPVSYPAADRGHQLDTLVRRHALTDRFRDVVVVTDRATVTLMLRAIASDEVSSTGSVTVVGLPREGRRIAGRRAAVSGVALGVVAGVAEPSLPIVTLPAAVTLVGLALLLPTSLRHLGRELLLAALIAVGVVLLLITAAARFPGG